jgi:hypothetical protein
MTFYVYGFARSTNIVKVASLFSEYGEVTAVKLWDGKETRCAILTMDDEAAESVMEEFDGEPWDGRYLKVTRSPIGKPA